MHAVCSAGVCWFNTAPPTLAAARIHFWRKSDEGGVWRTGTDEPLVRTEEEVDGAGGAEVPAALTALMIS